MYVHASGMLVLTCCAYLTIVRAHSSSVTNMAVEPFSEHDKTTAEIVKSLARHAHVPMGISGFVVNNQKRIEPTISVDAHGQSLREILDDVCRQDPQYKWQETPDNGIAITLGARRLSLLDVSVRKFNVKDVRPMQILGALLTIPEVKKWEQAAGCRVGYPVIINGQPEPDLRSRTSLTTGKEPLWRVLNAVSKITRTYTWSAISSTGPSCFIVLDTLPFQ